VSKHLAHRTTSKLPVLRPLSTFRPGPARSPGKVPETRTLWALCSKEAATLGNDLAQSTASFSRRRSRFFMQPVLTLDDADIRHGRETLYIRSCHEFRPAGLAVEDYRTAYARILNCLFRPQMDIISTVAILPQDTIGVHVRHGDKRRRLSNRRSKRGSYLKNYLPKLSRLLDDAPSRKIFAASDDDRLKDHLQTVWRERVITYPNVVQRRDSIRGVRHALRDPYILGKCSIILIDGDSTFGPLAARYENTAIENMRKDFRCPGPLQSLFLRAADSIIERPSRVLQKGLARVLSHQARPPDSQ